MIHHVTTPAFWQTAIDKGFYEVASLQLEGFIHCCKSDQLEGVIKRYYSEIKHLMIMDIDESKLRSDIIYELSPAVNELFPHVYGIINMEAIENIHSMANGK